MDSAAASISAAEKKLCDVICDAAIDDIPKIAKIYRDIQTVKQAYDEYMSGGDRWLEKNIEDELRAAEKYLRQFEQTGEVSLKNIGRDELKHAQALLNMGQPEAYPRLRERYQELARKLAAETERERGTTRHALEQATPPHMRRGVPGVPSVTSGAGPLMQEQ